MINKNTLASNKSSIKMKGDVDQKKQFTGSLD